MNEIQEYIEELFIDEVGVSYHTQGISWQAIVRVLDREIDGHGLLRTIEINYTQTPMPL